MPCKITIKREDMKTEFGVTQEELDELKRDDFFNTVLADNPRAKFTIWKNNLQLQI